MSYKLSLGRLDRLSPRVRVRDGAGFADDAAVEVEYFLAEQKLSSMLEGLNCGRKMAYSF